MDSSAYPMTDERFNRVLDMAAERANRLPQWKQESIRQWEHQARNAQEHPWQVRVHSKVVQRRDGMSEEDEYSGINLQATRLLTLSGDAYDIGMSLRVGKVLNIVVYNFKHAILFCEDGQVMIPWHAIECVWYEELEEL